MPQDLLIHLMHAKKAKLIRDGSRGFLRFPESHLDRDIPIEQLIRSRYSNKAVSEL